MAEQVYVVIHFLDGTSMRLDWPRQISTANEPAMINGLRNALRQEQLVVGVEGDLLIIPVSSIKYVHLSPAPSTLPPEAVTGAHLHD